MELLKISKTQVEEANPRELTVIPKNPQPLNKTGKN